MKNHFIFSYTGNKRTEVETIYENLNLENIKTIIEPFCGSSAISFYISTLHPGQFKYVLNDNCHNLIKLYEIARDEKEFKKFIENIKKIVEDLTRDKYNEMVNSNNFEGWFLSQAFYLMRRGLYPNEPYETVKKKSMAKKDFEKCPIINFLRTEEIIFSCNDANDLIFSPEFNNPQTLIICDPPYLLSNNKFYDNVEDGNCNFYENVLNNQIKIKARFCCVLEYIWIVKYAFHNWKFHIYDKKYNGFSKKKTKHCLITLIN